MKSLKKQYRDLEMQVMALLRDSVNNSEIESEHINEKAIEVSVYGFNELTIRCWRTTILSLFRM
jgi:hypothetical protein